MRLSVMQQVTALKFKQRCLMDVFLFDYSSGGGRANQEYRSADMHHGEMMHRALLADLAALPEVNVTVMRDARLPRLDPALVQSVQVMPVSGSFESQFDDCVVAADAVWLVAPEADGILAGLSQRVLGAGRILLGSAPDAVRLAASKLCTIRTLRDAGISVVPTYTSQDNLSDQVGASAWVVKPDKGAGCRDTRIFSGPVRALAWIEANGGDDYVLQPFISGQPCSLSLLCCDGWARLLSCNKQRIAVRDNQLYFLGSMINSFVDSSGEFDRLAQQIAAAIPGLWGYVGVDFILSDAGAVVLEINPQMTTSFTGLRASIGCNPAGLVVELLDPSWRESLPERVFSAVTVSVDVAAFDGL